MEIATAASRGSPLVEKSPRPIQGNTDIIQITTIMVTGFCK
ncbi:hypothetical protein M096_3784 [Parabacteroides distasonis str. 3999B T(B) 6]|nr:hypothetical protein M096_3784 [Parabacteroides distasonis str. 3999B T(B) 6]